MSVVGIDKAREAIQQNVGSLDAVEFKKSSGGAVALEFECTAGQTKANGITLAKSGQTHLEKILKLPGGGFLDRLSPELKRGLLDHLVRMEGISDKYLALVQNNQVIQWIKKGQQLIDDMSLLDVVEEVCDHFKTLGIIDIDKAWFSPERSNFAFYLTNQEILADPKDSLYVGYTFDNSCLGITEPSVTGYVYRKVCANGLRGPLSGFSQEMFFKDQEYLPRVRDFLIQAIPQARNMADQFVKLKNVPVEDPNRALHSIAEHVGIPKSQREGLLLSVAEEVDGVHNMYDAINVLTRYAGFQSQQRAVKLQTLAGDALEFAKSSHTCDHCYSMIR